MQDKTRKIAKHDTGDEVKHFDKKDANIYVFKKGNTLFLHINHWVMMLKCIITHMSLKAKAHYKENFNSKGYYEEHEPDYKEENMN